MAEANNATFKEKVEALLIEKLPEDMREKWIAITQDIKTIQSQGRPITSDLGLMDRMDAIMLTDEFLLAEAAANKEVANHNGIDVQGLYDASPKPTLDY